MKKLVIVLAMVCFCGCGGLYPPWEMANFGKPETTTYNPQLPPVIGMAEDDLVRMWGRGSDSNYYAGPGVRTTWYTRTLLGMLPGYHDGNPFYFQRYLIWIRDGKVVDYSIH